KGQSVPTPRQVYRYLDLSQWHLAMRRQPIHADQPLARTEKFNQVPRNDLRFFVLQPMTRFGETDKLSCDAISQTLLSHFYAEKRITITPQNSGRNAHYAIWKSRLITKGRSVPMDHSRQGARL